MKLYNGGFSVGAPSFSVDSLRTTVGGSRLQASLADPNWLSMENRRFAPPGGSVGVPKEPNLESLRDSLAKRPKVVLRSREVAQNRG